MDSSWIGLATMLALIGLMVAVLQSLRIERRLRTSLTIGVTTRLLGAIAYVVMITTVYHAADANAYYKRGIIYAERFSQFDFSPLYDTTQWVEPKWWGTQFIHFASGAVISLVGANMLATFIVFALIGFVGLLAIVLGLYRAYPEQEHTRQLRWLFLFPSLMLWPSAIGKEAVMLLGFGLVFLGVASQQYASRWLLMAAGIGLTICIRPQVAAVLMLALILAYTFARAGEWTPMRIAYTIAILVVGAYGMKRAVAFVGVESLDPEQLQQYAQGAAHNSQLGGSSIAQNSFGPLGVLEGFVSTFLRPFPWEARSGTAALSSFELWGVWLYAFTRRRQVWDTLTRWRSDITLCFAIIYLGAYGTSLGMLTSNLGILERQRIYIFPCIFLIVEYQPVAALVRRTRARTAAAGGRAAGARAGALSRG